jgi:hypothetical protein
MKQWSWRETISSRKLINNLWRCNLSTITYMGWSLLFHNSNFWAFVVYRKIESWIWLQMKRKDASSLRMQWTLTKFTLGYFLWTTSIYKTKNLSRVRITILIILWDSNIEYLKLLRRWIIRRKTIIWPSILLKWISSTLSVHKRSKIHTLCQTISLWIIRSLNKWTWLLNRWKLKSFIWLRRGKITSHS